MASPCRALRQVGKAGRPVKADREIPTVVILGVPVAVIDLRSAVDIICGWVREEKPRFVTAVDVHGVMFAQRSPAHMSNLRRADLVTPDGSPLVWVGRARGHRDLRRVAGPDLLPALCARSAEEGWRHYFYGGAPGVADELARRLCQQFPGMQVAGVESPPFRPLDERERKEAAQRINASGAHIVWVGLGCPKQEQWISDTTRYIDGAILIAVGAAFDFQSGRISRAPRCMQRWGLEWLHRLCMEPRRLWRRYLVLAPAFVILALSETAKLALRRAYGPHSRPTG